MTLNLLSIIQTKSLRNVFLTMRLGVSIHSVMTKHVGDISVGERQQPKVHHCGFYWPTLF